MDEKISGFLQAQAEKVVIDVFANGRNPASLQSCIVAQRDFYETMERVLREATPPERSIQCSSGCSACCHQKVAATIPEAIGMSHWLREQSVEEQQRVLKASIRLHDKTAELGDLARIRVGLPCPLLKSGRCSAYQVRPIACRMAYSFSRSRCEKLYLKHRMDMAIPHYEMPIELHTQILLGFTSGLEAVGLDGGLVELSSAIALLLADDGLVSGYLSGDKGFEAAKLGRFRSNTSSQLVENSHMPPDKSRIVPPDSTYRHLGQ